MAHERGNMDRAANAFVRFKHDTIAAGAAAHGLHPVYHVKLEVRPFGPSSYLYSPAHSMQSQIHASFLVKAVFASKGL